MRVTRCERSGLRGCWVCAGGEREEKSPVRPGSRTKILKIPIGSLASLRTIPSRTQPFGRLKDCFSLEQA
eukprot:1161179-Pelagomonas_calceolata.AAC.7